MLSLAADFWPLFWTIIGAGALLTVLGCLLVATFSPTWFRSRQQHRPTGIPSVPAQRQAGHGYQAGRSAKAA